MKVTNVRLVVAERVDIIVDFSKIKGSRLYLVNRAEQVNGRGPTGRSLNPGTPLLQINIGATAPDATVDFDKSPNAKLRDLPDMNFASLQAKLNDSKVKKRTWRFDRGNGVWTVNGKLFDEHVMDAEVGAETEEIWSIQNNGGSWRHPVHIHFEEFRIPSRNGVPVKPATQVNGAIDYARRDVVNLQTNEEVKVFIRFRDMPGRYVMHCHNVLHEDHAMMIQFEDRLAPIPVPIAGARTGSRAGVPAGCMLHGQSPFAPRLRLPSAPAPASARPAEACEG